MDKKQTQFTAITSVDSSYYLGVFKAATNRRILFSDFLNSIFPSQTGNAGKILKTDGTSVSWTFLTLNTLTGLTQTFATGTSGLDFAISSAGTTHTFNLPTASSINTGKLSNTDWATFNAKIGGSGTINTIPKFSAASSLIDGSWAFSANDIIPLTANSNIGSASNYVGTIFLGSTLRYASNLIFSEAGTERGRWDGANLGIGIASPSALLHLAAGTATAGTAPIKLTSGIVNTISEVGAIEFTTDSLFFTGTTGATRKTISDFVYRGISAARTLDGSDEFVDCISGTFAVTLPTAVGFTKQYVIKNSGTGVITINTTSSQTIDGNASGTLNLNQYDTYILKSDGTNWVLTSGATVSSITDLDFHLVCSFKQLYNY